MLAIARALCTEPKVLLLDEPTEGLQPSMIALIRDTIARPEGRQGVATVLVEQRVDAALAARRPHRLRRRRPRRRDPPHRRPPARRPAVPHLRRGLTRCPRSIVLAEILPPEAPPGTGGSAPRRRSAPPMALSGIVAGIDVGGTFTDLVLFDPAAGTVRLAKTPTTPDEPGRRRPRRPRRGRRRPRRDRPHRPRHHHHHQRRPRTPPRPHRPDHHRRASATSSSSAAAPARTPTA